MKLLRMTTSTDVKEMYVEAAVRVACSRIDINPFNDAESMLRFQDKTVSFIGKLVDLLASRGQLSADDLVVLTEMQDVLSAELVDG
jgi:hypothetical protein